MSLYRQKYPVLAPLPIIQTHTQLPVGAAILGQCTDEHGGIWILVKRERQLSVLKTWVFPPKTGLGYCCWQFDYPLKALSWFPQALEEFQKPPSEGGLHAGGMISKDFDVDGEMLSVGRTTDGYFLTNWSRNYNHRFGQDYEPTENSWSSEFLYDLGFLDLWKSLGEKYERGEI